MLVAPMINCGRDEGPGLDPADGQLRRRQAVLLSDAHVRRDRLPRQRLVEALHVPCQQ